MKVLNSYDIIAVYTKSEKVFHTICTEYDVKILEDFLIFQFIDIITFNLTEKLPFNLKRGPVSEAINKKIMFEINYSEAISGLIHIIFSIFNRDATKKNYFI